MPEGVLAYTWTPDSHVQTINAYRRSAVAVNGAITNGTASDVSLGYAYDCLGRLGVVTNGILNVLTKYAYDGVGNLAGCAYPCNWQFSYAYNQENRLISLDLSNGNGLLRGYSYGLNAVGYRTNVTETTLSNNTVVPTRQVRYDYDRNYAGGTTPARVYRLTRETIFDGSGNVTGAITNVFDAVGNRNSRQAGFNFTPVDAIANQSFVFDHRDLIDNDSIPNNANPNYDANGNTLVDQGTATGDLYDAENRLIATGSGIEITYDAEGNRVSKTVGGATTYYLVDDQNPTGYAQVLAEYGSISNGSRPVMTYACGLQLISHDSGLPLIKTVQYFGYDGQGSVRLLTGSRGLALLDTYDYDANGMLLASTGSDVNNYRYTGQQWDPDLGMYYLRARYYKPNLVRFWTADTYQGSPEDPLTLHKYLYCQANPVNMTDPTGHDGDLCSLMMSTTIGASLDSMYNGGVTAAGNAMMATLRGVQENMNAQQILTGYLVDTAVGVGVGLAIGAAAQFSDELIFGGGVAANACFVAGTPVAMDYGEKAHRANQGGRSGLVLGRIDGRISVGESCQHACATGGQRSHCSDG